MLVPVPVRITNDGARGHKTRVEVAGQDISRNTARAVFRFEAGDFNHLDLALFTNDSAVEGHALVALDPSTVAALVALGWTPPPGVAVPARADTPEG